MTMLGTRSAPGGDAAVDADALRAALERDGHEVPGTLAAQRLSGGLSNLTYLIKGRIRPRPGSAAAEADRWVLRRPPLGHVLAGAHDMQREYRALEAVAGRGVPAPSPLSVFPAGRPLDAPCYVMSYVGGSVLSDRSATAALRPAERLRASVSLVETLAALHRVPGPAFSRTGRDGAGFAARQVSVWRRQWDACDGTAPLEQRFSRLEDALQGWARALPVFPGTAVHGDFRLDNCVFDQDMNVAAVLDWEMSAAGDPLCDLGLLLVYWSDPGDGDRSRTGLAERATDHPGFLTRAELVDLYGRLTGRDTSGVPWYVALGYYKLAAILQGINTRHSRGQTVGDGFDALGDRVPHLLDLGLGVLSGAH